jgi:hypothetical protein
MQGHCFFICGNWTPSLGPVCPFFIWATWLPAVRTPLRLHQSSLRSAIYLLFLHIFIEFVHS